MKRYNNKTLIIVLSVLVTVFVLSRFFRSSSLETNLRKEIVRVDTASITEVHVMRPGESEAVKLVRTANNWNVQMEGKEARADQKSIQTMLEAFGNMNVQRMVSRKKEKWETYQVGDSSAISVVLYADKEEKANLKIGKIGFTQGGKGDVYTYVRLVGEDEVYATEGFLNSYFNKDFKGWRSKTLIRLNSDEVIKISFQYPDSGFVLSKRDSLWYVEGALAKRDKVDEYLNMLRFKEVTDFEEGTIPSTSSSPISLQIDGTEGSLATLRAWPRNEEAWTISSTLQEGVYFIGKRKGVVKDVFVTRQSFLN